MATATTVPSNGGRTCGGNECSNGSAGAFGAALRRASTVTGGDVNDLVETLTRMGIKPVGKE